ncbi:phage T7 F exclusion suppressor FxsA [compost metagenome]
MLLAIAAVLLIIPGFLGDFVAILLLLPPVRAWLYRTLTKNMTVVETTTTYRHGPDQTPPNLEGPGTIDLDDDDWQRK